jgi:hypothetical protein
MVCLDRSMWLRLRDSSISGKPGMFLQMSSLSEREGAGVQHSMLFPISAFLFGRRGAGRGVSSEWNETADGENNDDDNGASDSPSARTVRASSTLGRMPR